MADHMRPVNSHHGFLHFYLATLTDSELENKRHINWFIENFSQWKEGINSPRVDPVENSAPNKATPNPWKGNVLDQTQPNQSN